MITDRLYRPLAALPAVAAATLLAGCASTYSASAGRIDDADFGEANRQTYAAMIINPDPQYGEDMRTSAEHAAAAAERYREGEVKQPEDVSSRDTGGGS